MSFGALACIPPVCPISAAGGKSKHKLVNQCALRLAFKVKCSNNSNYTVNHIYGFVPIGGSVDLEITRIPGKPKADRLEIQFTDVTDAVTDPKAAFLPGAPRSELTGELTVKLSAAE